MPNVFVLKNTDLSGHRILDLANIFYDLPETRYAHPDFSTAIEKHGYMLYDYFHEFQPHIKKVIGSFNNASVWDFAGLIDTIVVAVLDDGITDHDDLPASRILPGFDFVGDIYNDTNLIPDPDPKPGDLTAHGMGVVGIIGASHTKSTDSSNISSGGMISLYPNVKVLPVKIFLNSGGGYGVLTSHLAEAVSYARMQGADILANSWGYYGTFVPPSHPILDDAIERAFLFGRNGRGCPIIFSSGNSGNNSVAYPSSLSSCFSVGATQLDDIRFSYSQYGSELDIVAPSGSYGFDDVWTLDQMDSLGYNPAYFSDCPPTANDENYNCHFGGTSAASPVVSGTVALLLAKDPTLSSQSVYYILRNSAVTNLDWGTISPPDEEYGYGRVDAFNAILSLSRGDSNNNDVINIADLTFFVDWMFHNGLDPFPSLLLADCNCDGEVTIADLNYFSDFLFMDGFPPVKPCFEF